MYKCQECTKQVKFDKFKRNSEGKMVRESALKVIAKARIKTYKYNLKKGKKIITKESTGWEITKELLVCRKCYKDFPEEQRA